MFSIEKLTELDSNQVKITDEELTGMEQTKFKKDSNSSYNHKFIKSYTKQDYKRKTTDLPISITDTIKVLGEYYYKFNKYSNSFLSSILNAIDPTFEYLTNKKDVIAYTKKQLGYELGDNHRNFGYSRKRIYKKDKMQKYLLDKYDIDDEKYVMIRKYIVDYFNINVLVINKVCEIETIFSQKDNDIFIQQRPTIILYYHDKRYSPIYNKHEDDSLFLYEKYNELIDELIPRINDVYKNSIAKKDKLNNYNVVDDDPEVEQKDDVPVEVVVEQKHDLPVEVVVEQKHDLPVEVVVEQNDTDKEKYNSDVMAMKQKLSKSKIAELTEYANTYNIDIYKVSPITNKNIKKLKKDLVEDLMKVSLL